MTPADMAAGIAPGPRTDASCGDGDAGSRSPLPKTRRTERVAVDPGPMPPRWSCTGKSGDVSGYLHNVRRQLGVRVHGTRVAIGGDLFLEDEEHGDLADLLAWLRRGGR